MILIVDNFDSFTFNLVDYFKQLGEECLVVRNDVSPKNFEKNQFSAIILSPGPGKPESAGFLMEYINYFEHDLPILGICLGHQAIAKYYGATVEKALKPMHGKLSEIFITIDKKLFKTIPKQFSVVRYHSLVVKNLEKTPLKSLAETIENENMIFKHDFLPIYGIQYHPEAALTEFGLKILSNWQSTWQFKKEAISI